MKVGDGPRASRRGVRQGHRACSLALLVDLDVRSWRRFGRRRPWRDRRAAALLAGFGDVVVVAVAGFAVHRTLSGVVGPVWRGRTLGNLWTIY
jgi:hypothetical protein